ncbi:hypothetical protein BT93_L5588 [Corymbia citriodora subsp. variegata]|uniref:Uncharacterized protein n=1 Tax=Corymbia citriodora subsp. variegata TaxID=360336 RepID=A0A8T0CF39_CORYI|nr:hypothetical protein BT93_L5588 [Corymbia citriodora subsp. variegata]
MLKDGRPENPDDLEKWVETSWSRMSGSSVWLERYSVFMTVTRVFEYAKGVRHWSRVSFLRVQLFDQNWQHLQDHSIEWQGKTFTFPCILDVDFVWARGGVFYGPEDPRIAIRPDDPDAEPVIACSMMSSLEPAEHDMFIVFPFSNRTVLLNSTGTPRSTEKNWSPFFLPLNYTKGQATSSPNRIHFIHKHYPLTVLECKLSDGTCITLYKQVMDEDYTKAHGHFDAKTTITGGTNLVLLPEQTRPGLLSYIALPRTHTDVGCKQSDGEAGYRPELTVITTDGTSFWFDYYSDPIEYGEVVFGNFSTAIGDACNDGRILLTNSIARIEPVQDIVTVTISVADKTVQVLRIRDTSSTLPKWTI